MAVSGIYTNWADLKVNCWDDIKPDEPISMSGD